jgi:hypothetical protein
MTAFFNPSILVWEAPFIHFVRKDAHVSQEPDKVKELAKQRLTEQVSFLSR